jgi:hypothetical protein
MRPFLLTGLFCVVAIAACHKEKAALPPSYDSDWKLLSYQWNYGSTMGAYSFPPDSVILLSIGNGQVNTYDQGNHLTQDRFTVDKIAKDDRGIPASYDYVMTFTGQPWLTTDGSLRLPRKMRLSINQDTLSLISCPIAPSGAASFIFVKQKVYLADPD